MKKKERSQEKALLPGLSDTKIKALARMAKRFDMPVSADVITAYIALRKQVLSATPKTEPRNCDVMTTAAALRKGWERRCEYGTPCCPFVYAMEPFYGEDRNDG